MVDLNNKDYVVIVQCHIVKQRCPGYLCEKAFTERTGGFSGYPQKRQYRKINLTCGGCCGRALHRKLTSLKRSIKEEEDIDKDRLVVQFSTCMTKDNYHAPPCPHLDYIRELIAKIGIDVVEDTTIYKISEQKRKEGIYKS